jgi:tetrahydromethanopterin S-methyltransferase subunit A
MEAKEIFHKVGLEIERGMRLAKCRKCGCMKDVLESLRISLPSIKAKEASRLIKRVDAWLKKMQPLEYACLGCKHCFPAEAMNILTENFETEWPPESGEYFNLCRGAVCPVAVSTLASFDLAKTLAKMRPKGLCIVGKTETENIGIDKIIKNIISNSTIRFLILAGQEPEGHYSGRTLLALSEKGVDRNMKIIGTPGRRPILKNVTLSEVESFRRQVRVINMIGCKDTEEIISKIDELSREVSTCECKECEENENG